MIVRVRADIWIDVDVLRSSDPGWDIDPKEDPRADAEYAVRCATDALPGLVKCEYTATRAKPIT